MINRYVNASLDINTGLFGLLLAGMLGFACVAGADTTIPGKVYLPYVVPGETELELRSVYLQDADPTRDGVYGQQLGFGKTIAESWFVEGYVTGTRNPNANREFEIDGIELEAIVQLTEQGEYDADWGAIFEFERSVRQEEWALASGVLVSRDWGRWSGSLNFLAAWEYLNPRGGRLETRLATQLRYRYKPWLEPAIELYSQDNAHGLGPVLSGTRRFSEGRKLHWELGVIMGLDKKSPDQSWKLVLEYEF